MSLGNRLLKGVFAVLFILFGSLPLSLATVLVVMGQPIPSGLVPVLLVLQIAIIAFGVWFAKWQSYITLDRVWLSAKAWKTALLGFLGMYAVGVVGSLLIDATGQTTTANQELVQKLVQELPWPLMFLAITVNAPLIEEVICRGLIPDIFKGRFILLGHLLGTLVFAALHGPTNLGSWLIYGGMGMILALIRYKTDRLEYAILAHAINNLVAFIQMMLLIH